MKNKITALILTLLAASHAHARTTITEQDFGDVVTAPSSFTVKGVLSAPVIQALNNSTGTLRSDLASVGGSTSSFRAEFVAIGASTAAAQVTLNTLAISTANIQANLNAVAASTNSIQGQFVGVGASTASLQSQVGNLGASTATLQAQLVTVGASTAALQSQVNAVAAATNTIQGQFVAVGASTATLQSSKVDRAGDTVTGFLNIGSSLTASGDVQIGSNTATVSTFSAGGFISLANLPSAPAPKAGRLYFDSTGAKALRVSLDGATFVALSTGAAGGGGSSSTFTFVTANASQFTGDGTTGNALTLNPSSVTLLGNNPPAANIGAGTLASNVVASSVATVLPELDTCGGASQSCVLKFGQDGRARFVSTATIAGGGGGGSGVGWSRDNGANLIYVTTATDNVVIGSTLTVNGGSGSTYSVQTSSGIKMLNGCIQFPSGKLQCEASPNPLVLASPSNGNYRVGVADDGALTTSPTTDAALPDVQLISPNGTSYRMGVSNDGALNTRPSN